MSRDVNGFWYGLARSVPSRSLLDSGGCQARSRRGCPLPGLPSLDARKPAVQVLELRHRRFCRRDCHERCGERDVREGQHEAAIFKNRYAASRVSGEEGRLLLPTLYEVHQHQFYWSVELKCGHDRATRVRRERITPCRRGNRGGPAAKRLQSWRARSRLLAPGPYRSAARPTGRREGASSSSSVNMSGGRKKPARRT
ncbi:MAG: hypothetical protein JWO04_2886 [Gammaproteobacteria bacterium]|nr:hypothetical protein [Gammaproteobacteria bacterium]